MKISDIYGTVQTGQASSNADMNPSAQTAGAEKQAQARATGSKMNYGLFALLAFFGVMLGLKHGLEKRGS